MTEDFDDFIKRTGKKWQDIWDKEKTFEADPNPTRPKFFLTFPYPYVNASVHLGHGYTVLKADFLARYKRMNGYNVLFPQGFHATGEPIVGMAKRLVEGDESQLRILRMSGISEDEIPKFHDPLHIVKTFVPMMEGDLRSIAVSVDWRRKFVTAITPSYSKFISWQYETLHKNGRVGIGSHPVVYCPKCDSPTGDHDRLEGEGATVQEYTLLKFSFEDAIMPAATLRPETIYGVTNMYLHPDANYVKAKVDDEKWIVSKEAFTKISEQGYNTEIITEHKGREFIGKTCKNPVTDHEIPIFPAVFVDPTNGSGVVMSVPSHAPVDWVVIKNLKDNPESLIEYGISPDVINSLKPISLITVEGYGEHPAIEIIEEMGITDQKDPQVEIATKTVYKKEFHTGFTKEITGKYAGTPVKEIKDILIEDFTESRIVSPLYETSEPVVCRCGTPNYVKVLSEQWFLKYGDPGWKQLTQMNLEEMAFYPPEIQSTFSHAIDWYNNKACARKSGLGTPLPFDKDWIVETLSDSTIYMAYYTLSHFFNSKLITAEQATSNFFSYIFQNEGDPQTITEETNISEELLERIKGEFEYWYPMDIRLSAKDLVMNHLTFCLFQHTAMFKPEHQPQAYSVNGYMSFEGQKMSKSKGLFTPLSSAVEIYGVDLTRLGLLQAGEGLDDAKFIEKEVRASRRWLEMLYKYSNKKTTTDQWHHLDKWLISRLQGHIEAAIGHAENLRTRSFIQVSLFDILNDMRWYLRRSKDIGPAFETTLKTSILLLNPVVPHFSEEIWESWDEKERLTFKKFPETDESKKELKTEEKEQFLRDLMEDIEKIKQATKMISFDHLALYVAEPWKYKVFSIATSDVPRTELIKSIMKDPEIKKQGSMAVKYAQKLQREFPRSRLFDQTEEYEALDNMKSFLEETYNCKISITHAKDAIDKRAKLAEPYRPAITLS